MPKISDSEASSLEEVVKLLDTSVSSNIMAISRLCDIDIEPEDMDIVSCLEDAYDISVSVKLRIQEILDSGKF